ncbi:MAG TPA: hypothetical protein VKK61_00670, partial [Tepidisphaeraceae bacterium]|nr:hypothetical protein [Tepidisphaeraceae bacterium]
GADDLALEALSAPDADLPSVESLSDTTFDKAVREFGGDEGEIIEPFPPAAESSSPQKPPTLPPQLKLEAPPAEPASTAAAEKPIPEVANLVPWEANQDNFIGGKTLDKKSPLSAPKKDHPVADEAVNELIEEIDSVAAAAEAAAAAPPPNPDQEPPLIVTTPRRRGPNVFRNVAHRRRDPAAKTNGETHDQGELKTSFDGLALTPVREMDVFSNMSPPALADEVGGNGNGAAHDDEKSNGDSPRYPSGLLGQMDVPPQKSIARERPFDPPRIPRPALPGPIEGEIIPEARPTATYAAELSESEVAAIRRRYFRRVSVLVATMTLLIAASAFAIYNFLGVRSTVLANVTFKNLSSLTQLERNRFQLDQMKLLKDETTRRIARRVLSEKNPAISPGFLDEQVDYFKTADRTTFSDTNADVMVLAVYGNDPVADAARAGAMATAAYEANSKLLDDGRTQRQTLDDLNKQINQNQQQLASLNDEIEKLRTLGESSPTPEQLAQVESQVNQLEKTWNDSVAAVKAAQAELERIKSAPAGGADANANAMPIDDDKTKEMQSQLDELSDKVNADKAANSQQAATAKRALDSAIETFAKQVEDAQSMVNGDPQIAAYIEAAQKLQQTTRQLTDDLIRRQEQQFGRLTELRERLNDKMEQRRVELWQSDK